MIQKIYYVWLGVNRSEKESIKTAICAKFSLHK